MSEASPNHAVANALVASSRPRIGIFQAEWPLQVHTINSVLVLAESGFYVDLFLYRVREHYVKGSLDDVPGVRVIRLSKEEQGFSWQDSAGAPKLAFPRRGGAAGMRPRLRPLEILWRNCRSVYVRHYPTWLGSRKGLMPASVLPETFRVMKHSRYKALIGVEKAGLVWAGQVAERLHVPYLYHSLELYARDGRWAAKSARRKCLKRAEERYHRRSYATIVQDRLRAEVLFTSNRMKPGRTLYVPVSLMGQPHETRSSFFQELFHLGGDRIIILQFGFLSDAERFGAELAQLAQSFPDEWSLVIHAPPAQAHVLRQIREADANGRVLLSPDMVPAARLPEVVSSAHIGLALYSASDSNDRLTAFSSEKLALYLQCGVPVIAFAYPGYEILENRRCGCTIQSLTDLPGAVERVVASWEDYSHNARVLYREQYEFRANYAKVVRAINELP